MRENAGKAARLDARGTPASAPQDAALASGEDAGSALANGEQAGYKSRAVIRILCTDALPGLFTGSLVHAGGAGVRP